MAMTCPNGHPVRESFAYCPYCMVKLDHEPPPPEPVVERGAAPEPPVAPPPPRSEPVAGPLPFAPPEASPPSRSSSRARGAVAAAVVAGALALVLMLVTDGDDDAAAPAPTAPTTATTARRPASPTTTSTTTSMTSSTSTSSTAATTATTAPPATTVSPPVAVALGAVCDPKAVPPGPMPSTSGEAARCVPQVWGAAEAQHVWWPVDTPVRGEWEVSIRWCDVGRHEATAGGQILSRSDRPRDLHLTVEFVAGDGTVLGAGEFVAPGVTPGDSVRWRIDVTGQVADIRECRVAGVRYRA